jgi:RNA polymerase sigma-70 factor (ECF subfamily)
LEKSPPNDQLSDADLLQRSVNGDEEAFVVLYKRHQGPVFRFALHMSGSRETAEEVTQDVFLALLAGLARYARERGPLQPYLIGMARNQVRRYFAQPPAGPHEFVQSRRELRCDYGDRLLNDINEEQELTVVRSAILNLPPNYREVVVLCDLEGLDYARAAAHLNCAVGTVRSRLHRARAILEARLKNRERCPA